MINLGWKRLLIVLSVLWLLGSITVIVYERQTINPFDQFEETLPAYGFWEWSPARLSAKKFLDAEPGEQLRHLSIQVVPAAVTVILPILCLWVGVLAFAWVREGFCAERETGSQQ
jgi:hypothetical protein